MDEQGKENGTPAENNPTGTEDYVEALKKLRDTTVPKTEYEKLKGENKRLLDTLVREGALIQKMLRVTSGQPRRLWNSSLKEKLQIYNTGKTLWLSGKG